MLNKIFSNIKQMKSLGLNHFKMETEAEGLTVSDMLARMAIMRQAKTPAWVKIGGCEAISDIKTCLGMGVDGITAPMIESKFALDKFCGAVATIYEGYRIPKISINIETDNAYDYLIKKFGILYDNSAGYLDMATIGCSDLYGSIIIQGKKTDYFVDVVKVVSGTLKQLALPFSIGGGITPQNVNQIIEDYQPDYVNTRNWCFNVKKIEQKVFEEEQDNVKNILMHKGKPFHFVDAEKQKQSTKMQNKNAITLALETEKLMLKYFNQPNNQRIEELEKRLRDG